MMIGRFLSNTVAKQLFSTVPTILRDIPLMFFFRQPEPAEAGLPGTSEMGPQPGTAFDVTTLFA